MPPSKKAARVATPWEDEENFSNNLIFGPPNGGKTTFLGLCTEDPRVTPIEILDFEGGVRDVLTGLPGYGKAWRAHRIRSWDDFNHVYNNTLIPNEEGAKAVGIDSLSETHIFALMDRLDSKAASRAEKDLIEQGDYGVGLVQIRRLVRKFRDLPMHTYFTAHHKTEVDPRKGLITMVNLAGKAATEIPGLMTVAGYLAETTDDEGDPIRSLLLHGDPKVRTKIRMPWGKTAPEFIDNPHPRDLLNLLGY